MNQERKKESMKQPKNEKIYVKKGLIKIIIGEPRTKENMMQTNKRRNI